MRVPLISVALWIACGTTVCAGEPALVTYVGSGSCATFGCHGNTLTQIRDEWKSSFVLWARSDPHAGAFDALFTERSAKMVEMLIPIVPAAALAERKTAERETEATTTSGEEFEENYRIVLEKRCVGCHATPAVAAAAEPLPATRLSAESLRHGVGCESCHGAASKWQTEHATSRWIDYTPSARVEDWGMTDTKSLGGRAAVCVECHVGPRGRPPGDVMDVDHDLIAAGHPRLTFELSAYLANLPPHWDTLKDQSRHGTASFQFDVWRLGQFQMARKLAHQIEVRSLPSSDNAAPRAWPEFSNYDCFACHHRLRAHRFQATDNATMFTAALGQPQPSDWPFAQLQAIVRVSEREPDRILDRPLTAARERLAFGFRESPASRQPFFADLRRALAASLQSAVDDRLSREVRVAILNELLAEILAGRARSWERVAQFNLALAAFVEDDDPGEPKRSGLAKRTQRLTAYLDDRFDRSHSGSIYNSPTQFDPTDEELRTQLREIAVELHSP